MTSPGFQICIDSEGYATDLGNGWVAAYWDKIGLVWTIGMGSTGPDIKKGTTWTRDHAVQRLQQGWDNAQAGVLRASPILLKYPVMLDAVTDFAYNCGVGAYQTSTMRRLINAGRYQDAAQEFKKWVLSQGKRVQGLVTRRSREMLLFVSGIPTSQSAPVVAPPEHPSPIANTVTEMVPPSPPVVASPTLRMRFSAWLRTLADRLE